MGEKRTLRQVRLRQGAHLAKEKPSPGAPSRQKPQNGAGKPYKNERRDRKVAVVMVADVAILFLVHAANSARYTRNTTVGGSYMCILVMRS